MKKIVVLCAAALFVTACAKVDGEKRSGPNFMNSNLRAQQQMPVNGQPNRPATQLPSASTTGVTPVVPVVATKACVPNVTREITIVEVEKFNRLSPTRFVIREGDTVASKAVIVVKAIKGKKVYSLTKASGPEVYEDETYDFTRSDIKSPRGTIAFSKNKILSEKLKTDVFSVNEADLIASNYAGDGDLYASISDEGVETRCSVSGNGYFTIDEKSQTIRVRIVLTETYYLNKLALRTIIRDNQ